MARLRDSWRLSLSAFPNAGNPSRLHQPETVVRRETGKEQEVQVLHSEGVANHTGPEPCAPGREATREASAGEPAGQPSSHESPEVPGADAVTVAEGNTCTGVSASLCRPGGVKEPGMQPRSLRGNREISRPTTGPKAVWSASGR
jgi:hypothetical protein